LRRTIFLLVVIHQLLGLTRTLDPAYFEPLLPPDVFENIRLPSSDAMWMAESESEWINARRGSVSDGIEEPPTLGEIVQRFTRGNAGDLGTGSSDLTDGDSRDDGDGRNKDREWSLERLPELTRLIISVASISVK